MRLIFGLFFTLFVTTIQSQTIQKFYDYNWIETLPANARFYAEIKKTDSGWHRSDYFLHEQNTIQMDGTYTDSSCKVANGVFYFFHPNKIIKYTGRYVNGKKQGLWLSYHNNRLMRDSTYYESGKQVGISLSWHPNGFLSDSNNVTNGIRTELSWFDDGYISSAGRYNSENKEIGKWQYFYRSGKLSSLETYDENGIILDKKYFDVNGNSMDTTNHDRVAEFPGGLKAWQKYLENKLYFPSQYKISNSDKAVVVIEFAVNEDGSIENVNVTTPFYEAFNSIAVDVIKKSPKWKPAFLHNRNVKYYHRQSVAFTQIEE